MRDNIIIDLILSKINTEKTFKVAIAEAHELQQIRKEKDYKYNSLVEHEYLMATEILDKALPYVDFTSLLYDTAKTGKDCVLEALEELKEKGKA